MFRPPRHVSLASEIELLAQALALLTPDVELPRADGAEPGAPVAAVLVLVRERLRLLGRVVRNQLDPRLVACAENLALPLRPGAPPPALDEGDVVLRVWSRKQRARHARIAIERERRARRFERAQTAAQKR